MITKNFYKNELKGQIEIGEVIRDCFTSIIKYCIYKERYYTIELVINKNDLETVLFLLNKTNSIQAKMLLDIVCVDLINTDSPKNKRFKLSYILNSIYLNKRLIITTYLESKSSIKTSSLLFESGVWLEREIWDMFGIYFEEHPDLRRILTDYGFNWYPLKKDFPITGYIEVYYDINDKKIAYKPIELMQEYRKYNTERHWGDEERKIYIESMLKR